MQFFSLSLLLFLLGCSSSQRIHAPLLKDEAAAQEPLRYETLFANRVFDKSQGHSFLIYPLLPSYPLAYTQFLDENKEIKSFFKTMKYEYCFKIIIEAMDLGRDEVEIAQWSATFEQKQNQLPLTFVKVPGVSPRIHMKHRLTQNGRETWWVNETYACAEQPLNFAQNFSVHLKSTRYDSIDYRASWKID